MKTTIARIRIILMIATFILLVCPWWVPLVIVAVSFEQVGLNFFSRFVDWVSAPANRLLNWITGNVNWYGEDYEHDVV